IIGLLSARDAAATSQVLVASATLARVLSSIYVQLHGSSSAQSVIILPYAALMLPPMMVGGLLGVYLYTWLPEIVQMVLYVLTAVLASCMGFKKGMRLWKSERAEASSIAEAATRSASEITAVSAGASGVPRVPSILLSRVSKWLSSSSRFWEPSGRWLVSLVCCWAHRQRQV
ncbi:hypothetical protein FOZ62_020328, partial [Perkinsus olseni]